MRIFLACLLFTGCAYENDRLIPYEQAYFEGQKDALNGDIRIEFNEKYKRWEWTKTCWEGGHPTTFDHSNEERY